MSMRNVGGDGKGCLGNRVQLLPIPTLDGKTEAREAKASAQGHTARPRYQLLIRRHSPYRCLTAC